MSFPSRLVVVRGFPFDGGSTFQLHRSNTLLGRKDGQWEPDLAFDNVYVSRKQASIYLENGNYYIMDLDSKHGTEVNGSRLIPFMPTVLSASDSITFARGMVILVFSPINLEETLDFKPLPLPSNDSAPDRMDPVRQIIRIHGSSYHFSEKEYRCLELLLRRERHFVGKDEIIRYVWPERPADSKLPPVSSEEINSLLYRIRKKTNHAISIENIRGKGYILQQLPAQKTESPAAAHVRF
ncbi:FHA domain-containing protein [Brevibacillus borstelensis]|uniref:FHA domain-containing protein n=1 Tax=Brevibacillus borstelensis TaxID=45462 RepID=UPI0030C45FFF